MFLFFLIFVIKDSNFGAPSACGELWFGLCDLYALAVLGRDGINSVGPLLPWFRIL